MLRGQRSVARKLQNNDYHKNMIEWNAWHCIRRPLHVVATPEIVLMNMHNALLRTLVYLSRHP